MVKFWLVGGAIRDEMLGITPKDLDFAVEAQTLQDVRDAIIGLGGRIFQEKPEFLTIRAELPALKSVDFVMCRKEGTYRDARHPENVVPGTIMDDLLRRDFTVNAMAQEFDPVTFRRGSVLDPFNGRTDLALKILRTVREPNVVFQEDALRIMRALRFTVQLNFFVENRTRNALLDTSNLELLRKLPRERIVQELDRMFKLDPVLSMRTLVVRFPDVLELVGELIGFRPTMEPGYRARQMAKTAVEV